MLIRGRLYAGRPARGDAARRGARRGDTLDAPPPRDHIPRPAPRISEKFERYEGTQGEVTLGDTDSTVIHFSGYPDTIFVQARTFGALVTFTDFLGREESPMVVHAGENFETHISRPIVKARNLTAGSNSLLSVVGKWAERMEPD